MAISSRFVSTRFRVNDADKFREYCEVRKIAYTFIGGGRVRKKNAVATIHGTGPLPDKLWDSSKGYETQYDVLEDLAQFLPERHAMIVKVLTVSSPLGLGAGLPQTNFDMVAWLITPDGITHTVGTESLEQALPDDYILEA